MQFHALHTSAHPLVKRDMTILRHHETRPEEFRHAMRRLARLLAYEASKDLPLIESTVITPLEETTGLHLAMDIVLVPILRAGLGLVDGFLDVFPYAHVGHMGIYRREETLEPVEYYASYPQALDASVVFLLDPMLATGGSSSAAIERLKDRGATSIRMVCIVAVPEGVKVLMDKHPDVQIFAAAYDRELNGKGYILPGLGDAGDRLYGTA